MIPGRDAGGLEDGGGLGSPDPAGAEGLGLGCGVLNLVGTWARFVGSGRGVKNPLRGMPTLGGMGVPGLGIMGPGILDLGGVPKVDGGLCGRG